MASSDAFIPDEVRNVGGLDRTLRFVGGTVLVAAGVTLLATGTSTPAVVALVAGVGLLFNAVTGFCGVNALLGVDTCDRE